MQYCGPSRRAFTLVEMLAVIAIIVALIVMVVAVTGYANRKSVTSQAQVELRGLESAIENYKADIGSYPTSTLLRVVGTVVNTNSALLYQQLTSGRTYFRPNRTQEGMPITLGGSASKTILDPWGRPYNYVCTIPPRPVNAAGTTGQVNLASFDLWSYGFDGTSGTADDVSNWQP